MNINELNKFKNELNKYNLSFLHDENGNNNEDIISGKNITLKCNECGSIFDIKLEYIIHCHPERKLTPCHKCKMLHQFISALNAEYGENPYTFLSEFNGREKPLTVKCNTCGYVWTSKKASKLLSNANLLPGHHPCKQCATNQFKQDISELESALTAKFGACEYAFPNPEEYMGLFSKKKMHIICKLCGHKMFTCVNNIRTPKNGKHYCRVCNHKDRELEIKTYKERCLEVTKGQIEPIEEYIDSRTPILHKCNICGNIWKKIPVKNTTRNAGCPVCSKRITQSKAELEILSYIKHKYSGTIVEKDRTVLKGQEIDIYLPDIHVGFEINGLYYHSFKEKDYHMNKTMLAQTMGIKLYQIFNDEWHYHKEGVKNIINNALSKVEETNKSYSLFTTKGIDEQKFNDLYSLDIYNTNNIFVYDGKDIVASANILENEEYVILKNFTYTKHDIRILDLLSKYIKDKYNKEILLELDRSKASPLDEIYRRFKVSAYLEPRASYVLKNKSEDNIKREVMQKENYAEIYDCGLCLLKEL